MLGAINASTEKTTAAAGSFIEVMKGQMMAEFSAVQEQLQSSSSSAADQQNAVQRILEMLVTKVDLLKSDVAEVHQEVAAVGGADMVGYA